jgi:hypothetical protein
MVIKVLTHPRRKPLITSSLKDISHEVIPNEDNYYDDATPCPFGFLNKWNKGAWRCWHGHYAMLMMLKENALIFEDDALPKDIDWLKKVRTAEKLLGQYEIVSLHARDAQYEKRFALDGLEFGELAKVDRETWSGVRFNGHWACGSLAYLITPAAAKRFIDRAWDGMPVDLLLYNFFKTACLIDSPFHHGMPHQAWYSLVENTFKQ